VDSKKSEVPLVPSSGKMPERGKKYTSATDAPPSNDLPELSTSLNNMSRLADFTALTQRLEMMTKN